MELPIITIENLNITLASGSPNPMPEVGPEDRRHMSATAPKIGELWPEQGGIYAGIMRGEPGGPLYHLIVSPRETEFAELQWGARGDDAAAAASTWDGKANTAALTAAGNHRAAKACQNLEHEGHRDWYLPARREAALCSATVPEIFSDGWHWTSTQCSANGAFIQGFGGGTQYDCYEGLTLRVRAVRRFLID